MGLDTMVMDDTIRFGDRSDLDPTQDFTFTCEGQVAPQLVWKQPYADLQVCPSCALAPKAWAYTCKFTISTHPEKRQSYDTCMASGANCRPVGGLGCYIEAWSPASLPEDECKSWNEVRTGCDCARKQSMM